MKEVITASFEGKRTLVYALIEVTEQSTAQLRGSRKSKWTINMIDLSPAQATDRITALLAAHESRSISNVSVASKAACRKRYVPLPIPMVVCW